jgi:lysophospholipase L1-like esterase
MVATIGPFEGFAAPPWTPAKEAVRVEVNAYIRGHHRDFDAVIDIDMVLRDPGNPTRMLPAYDSGDHIHPNDAGAEAIAAAVPLHRL